LRTNRYSGSEKFFAFCINNFSFPFLQEYVTGSRSKPV
jgi:hypothetical protein